MVKPQGTEVYAVIVHKFRGQYRRSIHVFQRMPNEYEMQAYENTATSVRFRNKDAHVKSSLTSLRRLFVHGDVYDTLVARAFDVPYGNNRILGEVTPANAEGLSAAQAIAHVDVMSKQKAMQELVGQVWTASSFDEDDDEEVKEEKPGPKTPVAALPPPPGPTLVTTPPPATARAAGASDE